jgi:hypothetical protein
MEAEAISTEANHEATKANSLPNPEHQLQLSQLSQL